MKYWLRWRRRTRDAAPIQSNKDISLGLLVRTLLLASSKLIVMRTSALLPLERGPLILAHAAQQPRSQRHLYPFSHPPIGHPCRALVPDDDAAPLLFLVVSSSLPVFCEGRRRRRHGRNSSLPRCRHGPCRCSRLCREDTDDIWSVTWPRPPT
jgi:hypothetical protein